ncbi:MAG TPA: Ppx/GppA family phosphatase [Streptomyces sp.]|uniref:Ppx/GppA phosphatase family protein n=1 Tax=Streptomyces sp. TaxID=1931 RepID=UPI002D4B5C36|nr:Ppx/GppA family phosphatase [Streptomyces sp.]HZG03062.1 Ppx/GppA family phosphatase [Streptomyces sp.]
MRLAVVDVGSNTVRLAVADCDGDVPLPVHTAKRRLRLAEHIEPDGRLGAQAVDDLVAAVSGAKDEAGRWGVRNPFAFGTAIIRDAPNRHHVLQTVRSETGVPLYVMSGMTEGELTFLAARQWMGWRAGPMVLLDIGGGSMEVAFGRSRTPDFVASLPLGAGRMTREYFGAEDPPPPRAVRELRRRVRHDLRDVATRIRWESPRTAVATSRTFQQLARLCGAAPGKEGPFVTRRITRGDLKAAVETLAALPAAARADLPGISAARARQSLAGAVVAHTAMRCLEIDTVTLSPWALREGVMIKHLQEQAPLWREAAGPHRVAEAQAQELPDAPLAEHAVRGGAS